MYKLFTNGARKYTPRCTVSASWAGSFFAIVVRRYGFLTGEVDDQALARVNFAKNTNLWGPRGGYHQE
uniref:Uncharacterized protein n=1 Tax=Romanomermis culicivorax TaxID=13658 RepID=A0A915HKT5_ROMCU